MIAFILAPFFIAFEVYLFIKTLKYLNKYRAPFKTAIPAVFAALLLCGVVATLAGFFTSNDNPFKRVLTQFGYAWFGYFLYFVIATAIAWIGRRIICFIQKDRYQKGRTFQFSVIFIIIFTMVMSLYGSIHAHKLKISNYELNVDKTADVESLNVALVADLHIGYNIGVKEIEDMVNKINALNPDLVIIAGDIFDNQHEALEDPERISELLGNIQSKYGTYAVLGNHDIEEKILMGFTFSSQEEKANVSASEEMLQVLSAGKINLLYDDYIEIEGVEIYGRPDATKYNLGNSTRLSAEEVTAKMDKEKPIIVIDHQPKELEELSKAGVDVDLSGHTHGGQVWPLLYINDFIWENPEGYLDVDGMHSIVTSGVGLFGVNMRTFSNAEICNIKISFNGND